ncbi:MULTISPECIES: rhodanese-like domain-containing protein [Bacillales]|uniref:Rhodanese-like domain-containing protein n=2 Tax=Lysinibacillus louembei TaxID=1470088 RepID=A0ABZ0RZZ0_9BACI|nr:MULTISPECIES: rhodanese-like domain-containing protein [Bacillales]MCT6925750.1 rhodanese-like domain-containing protein [Metasolibacillus sp.]MCT6941960.1 rhodanese-like domain-containing protein [Metasolibacillus sp.]WPK12862.1 rhodanese-like domain-containing protein [Lysinibacillus louembei]
MTGFIIAAAIVALIVWRMMPAKGVKTISTEELASIINDRNKLFIDVRTPAEYKGRHIPQAKNMPLGTDFSHLPKNQEIFVICQSGMRSAQACKQLKKLGYNNITNIRGGMNAWRG